LPHGIWIFRRANGTAFATKADHSNFSTRNP
jgi:hypothetical protein